MRVFVLGGSRSGKSAFAESLLAGHSDVAYVATAAPQPDDAEWDERVRRHRARRPAGWLTIETGDVADLLAADGSPVLLDSITAWLTRAMDEAGSWDAVRSGDLDLALDQLCAAWSATNRFAIAVSDEVGSGVVPATSSGRRFRDALGILNQRLAAEADEVHLVTAGIPQRLK
jgi:adenosylcobinamide kinase/adenosylcobinamide-phosphate guanylyltransferase